MSSFSIVPEWIDSTEARDAIFSIFGVLPQECKLIEVPRLHWNIEYEICPNSGLYQSLELRLVDLGYEDGYWCMEYAESIRTLFYRVYEG